MDATQNNQNGQGNSGGQRRRRFNTDYVAKAVSKRIPFVFDVLTSALIIIGGLTNLHAWHTAIGENLELKFSSTYTLGGLLTHPAFDGLSRLFILGLIVYHLFFRKEQKTILDWAMLFTYGVILFVGIPMLVDKAHWTLAVMFWFYLQSFQYWGIFSKNPTIKTAAFATYFFEFAVQCYSAPISSFTFWEAMDAISAQDFALTDIDWVMAFMNLGCMMSVEWLARVRYWIQTGQAGIPSYA